jgi:hypothetical protein
MSPTTLPGLVPFGGIKAPTPRPDDQRSFGG